MNEDLISRSALLEAIAAAFFKTDPTGEEQLGYLACNRIIRGFPAVDAEPVRHGRWESRGNYLKCSECGHEYTQYDWEGSIVGYYYCPNCGAKMDAEVEG